MDGYKIQYPESPTSDTHKFLVHLNKSLTLEGFKDNLIESYSRRPTNGSVLYKFISVNSSSPVVSLKMGQMLLVPFNSLSLDRFVYKPFKKSRKLECNWIRKPYNPNADTYRIHSAFTSLVKSVLERILFDSGLRLFWNRRYNDVANRKNNVPNEKVSVIQLADSRFQAMLKIFGVGTLFAGLMFSIDICRRFSTSKIERNITVIRLYFQWLVLKMCELKKYKPKEIAKLFQSLVHSLCFQLTAKRYLPKLEASQG